MKRSIYIIQKFSKYFLAFILFFNTSIANGTTVTFSHTGAQQTWTVPSGVTSITVEGYGAAGGDGESSGSTKSNGGLGGYLKATISVTPGDTLIINVGGVGESGADIANAVSAGGFNGGGDAANSYSTNRNGGGGGGATDIRTSTNLSDRIFVVGAGGGGGGGSVSGINSNGGAGGGTSGENGTDGEGSTPGIGGGGGSQASGGTRGTGNTNDNEHGIAGALGLGGDESISGGDGNCKEGNGGGGAGYYGGGSGGCGYGTVTGGGGGGGSSFTTGTIITNTQGHSSATGNGSLQIEYTANVLPTLSSSVPADNATDVARDANIVLNFSEIVDVETGNITIKKTSDDSTFETIDVTSSNVTGTGTTQITINPTSNFDAEIEYYILIDATAFDDVLSGSYAGISSTTALSFTTESMVDPTTVKDVVGSIDAQSQLAKSFITQSTSTVSSRLSYLRQNKDSQNLSKNNLKLDFGNAILTSLTNELLVKNDKSIIPDNWSSWSEGSLSSSKIGDSLGSSSSDTDSQALTFGFDTKLNDSDLLGFAIQYSKSDTDIGSSGSTTDSENINISIYRTRPLDDDNFIEGMFGVGLIESDLTRISGSNKLTGSRNGSQIFGSINYGKTIDKGDFNLTPIGRIDLGYTELDAYSETGTDALSYAKQTIESGLASFGLEFSDIVKFNDNKLKPFGSIEYGMDFSNSSNAKMNYVSDTTTIFTYSQGANSNHLVTLMVGFEYITKDNLEIISSYKRIQGNESEQTDILNVSVNFKSKRETEYAMSVDGSEDLKAGFDISKNVNGFDIKFNANQSLSENSDQTANVSLSRSF
jgi:hypothetical protein